MTMADTENIRAAAVANGLRESGLALVMVEAGGRVIAASRGAAELLATTPDDLVGSMLADHFEAPDPLHSLLAGGSESPMRARQLTGRRRDGDTIPLEIQCGRCAVGGGSGAKPGHCMLMLQETRARQYQDELRAARLAKLSLLNQVNEALYGAQLNLDQILQAVLVCMTAGQGLRFNRAFLLLVDADSQMLRGEMAIGPSNSEEAKRIWSDLEGQTGDLIELVTSYDKTIQDTDVAVNEIVRGMTVSLAETDHILVRTMGEGHVCRVRGDADQPGISTLRQWLGSHEFAIAPMSTRRGPVGVIVADNAISQATISDLDLEFLQVFANQSAGAIENSRLYTESEQQLRELRAAHKKQRQDQETLLKMERLSVMGETSAIVAHELRNPLVAIGGFARSLTRGLAADDTNRVAATIIVEEVARMERIISDLLDFIRPPKLLRQPLVVDEVVGPAAEKFRARASEGGVELAVELGAAGLVSEMHPGEIQQVMQNFLINALQALDGPGKVTVRTIGVGGGVRVAVADTGPGFDPDLSEQLQAPFFSTKPTGSGLGLTICTQIVKAHGGVIQAQNLPGGGAEFSFILTRAKDPGQL